MIQHCPHVPWDQVDRVGLFRVHDHIGNVMSIGHLTDISLEHESGAHQIYKSWEALGTKQKWVTQTAVCHKLQATHCTMSTLRYLLQIL